MKKKILIQIKKDKIKSPVRAGIKHTKIQKPKTLYKRHPKHKKKIM